MKKLLYLVVLLLMPLAGWSQTAVITGTAVGIGQTLTLPVTLQVQLVGCSPDVPRLIPSGSVITNNFSVTAAPITFIATATVYGNNIVTCNNQSYSTYAVTWNVNGRPAAPTQNYRIVEGQTCNISDGSCKPIGFYPPVLSNATQGLCGIGQALNGFTQNFTPVCTQFAAANVTLTDAALHTFTSAILGSLTTPQTLSGNLSTSGQFTSQTSQVNGALSANTINGAYTAGQTYSGSSTIQAAVNAAAASHSTVNVNANTSSAEMMFPQVEITNNTGTSTSQYTNYVAPVVQDNRPFNHDYSFDQAINVHSLDDINEGGDMAQAAKCTMAGACRVLVVGNSIHENNSAIAPDDGYATPFFQALQRKFPQVTFTFENFSIGGTTVENFNDGNFKCQTSGSDTFYRAPKNSPYTNNNAYQVGGPFSQWPDGCTVGTSWAGQVTLFNPDIVVMGFVENADPTQQGVYATDMFTAVNFVRSINGATIILSTDEPPNPNWLSLIADD